MAVETINDTSELTTTSCIACGIRFAAPRTFLSKRRESGEKFFCPNGHSLVFQETENDRLKKQVQQERQMSDQKAADAKYWRENSDKNIRRLTAAKGRITRIRNRCLKGLCTCCEEEFPDLEKHMRETHPDAATRDM